MLLSLGKNRCFFTLVCLLVSGCNAKDVHQEQLLVEDANAFCAIHEVQHWNDISSDTSIVDFNKITRERVFKVLKTKAFQQMLKEMDSVEFYRQMYPTAKSKIEKLTGQKWDCPAYEKFYSVKTSRDGSEPTTEVDIIITKEGDYFYKGLPFQLSSESLNSVLDLSNKPRTKLVVKLETGASESSLESLFQAIAPLGVENISVLSDE